MERNTFKEKLRIEPLYTGGKVVVAPSGEFFVCACTEELYVVDFATGQVLKRLQGVRY